MSLTIKDQLLKDIEFSMSEDEDIKLFLNRRFEGVDTMVLFGSNKEKAITHITNYYDDNLIYYLSDGKSSIVGWEFKNN